MRDTHLLMIDSLGWIGRQKATGYRRRSRGEAAQRTEAIVGVAVLNRMLGTAMANSVRRSETPASVGSATA